MAERRLSRRDVLGAAAAGTAGLVVGRVAGPLLGERPGAPPTTATATSSAYPFHGAHQGGIITPPQAHLQFAAFDMVEGADRRDLLRLLKDWSAAAARLTEGLPVSAAGALGGDPLLPPEDTGETMDLPASKLTITIAFGPGLFERDGVDRFGIASDRPPELASLPAFAGDALDPTLGDGDLGVQVCTDDPLVALHAMRNLARIAFGRATIRWSQTGFGGTAKGTAGQPTPRNLLGFKDGTANIDGADEAGLDEHVWLPAASSPGWLAGGTYLVVRRIAMLLEGWDGEPLSVQEATFGRTKGDGAPLSGGDESTPPDFEARSGGAYAIDPHAHIRLAHPKNNGGVRLLRRAYSYFDGTARDGHLDGGLLFLSYQRSPERFITVQRALATDLLNDFIRPVGSALFAVPPGASADGYVGETLVR